MTFSKLERLLTGRGERTSTFLYPMALVPEYQVLSIREKQLDYSGKVTYSSSFQRNLAPKSHCEHRKTNVDDGKGLLDHQRLYLGQSVRSERTSDVLFFSFGIYYEM
jgi:hypothetical protein